ncbi:MAG: hypothetical protein WKG07_46070 [Hymenobacter sp.]
MIRVRPPEGGRGVSWSAPMAWRTAEEAARRAGRTPASMPAIVAIATRPVKLGDGEDQLGHAEWRIDATRAQPGKRATVRDELVGVAWAVEGDASADGPVDRG